MGDTINTYGIESRISSLETAVNEGFAELGAKSDENAKAIKNMQSQVTSLREDFERMMQEQKFQASYQRASTELVAIRQQLAKQFGNYGVVRNTIVGILQATDSALVRKTTISQVSEELMISTPDYWLAPLLVALAAWIDNKKDLANRAIAEAVRRDNEHTSLAMALICRRNKRTNTCYEWLARYFSTQNAATFDDDDMVYIDAYINGIFGKDEKHMCDDYVSRWLDEVRSQDASVEDSQLTAWKEYFERFNVDETGKYPELQECVSEKKPIEDYLSRIDASYDIQDSFNRFDQQEVNLDLLRKEIDEKLVTLVNVDDKKERKLKDQEKYCLAVRKCGGDEQKAMQMITTEHEERKKRTMSIIDHMTHVVRDDEHAPISQKKTAVSLLRGYINEGYSEYLHEKKGMFPDEITLNVNGWQGKTTTGDNEQELLSSYANYLSMSKAQEEEALKNMNKSDKQKKVAIVLAIVGVIALFVAPIAGIPLLAVAAYTFFSSNKTQKRYEEDLVNLNAEYQKKSQEGKQKISNSIEQWKQINNSVSAFEKNTNPVLVS